MSTMPVSDIDLFADDVLRDPWPAYAELRAMGPAVWMSHSGFVAIPRYDEVRSLLRDDKTFISGQGVGLNTAGNRNMVGTIIATDGDEHELLRNVLSDRLAPRALRGLSDDMQRQADELVDSLVARRSFDAVPDLAQRFPLMVVVDLIGLPQEGREHLLQWGADSFNAFGPDNSERAQLAGDALVPIYEYAFRTTARGKLREGSMGAALLDAVDAGRIPLEKAGILMVAYVAAGLDTTISSVSNAIGLFAAHPEQWDRVRANPALIPGAYSEILRYEPSVHWFSRVAATDAAIGGMEIAAGSRVVAMFASANRDERKWPTADRFEVERAPADHLAFGYGTHGCAGQGLARLEAHSLFRALARNVERFEVGHSERSINSVLHGYTKLETTLHTSKDALAIA